MEITLEAFLGNLPDLQVNRPDHHTHQKV